LRAWVTPDEAGDTTRLISIRVPDDPYLYACFLGAVLLLSDPLNWEGIGTLTAEEVVAFFVPTYEDVIANAE